MKDPLIELLGRILTELIYIRNSLSSPDELPKNMNLNKNNLDILIEELPLDGKLIGILMDDGIKNVRDLCNLNTRKLRTLRNIGHTKIETVRKTLKILGLELKI